MTKYAAKTTVSVQRSRDEIEAILTRYGADQFMYGWFEGGATIAFRAHGRMVRFHLPLPDAEDPEIKFTPRRQRRTGKALEAAIQQAERQRWRALALVVKAKLEAVESGIVSFESEFLPFTVLPDNRTVGEWLEPQLEAAYQTGRMPTLAPALAPPAEAVPELPETTWREVDE